jgi:16S rRNA processing protein RimM
MPPPSRPRFADVDADALVRIGFVFRPHGVRGELKVDPSDTDDPARYDALDRVFLGTRPARVTEHAVQGVRFQQGKRGTTVILRLAGVDGREAAEAVAKQAVWAHEDDLPTPDEDEFFIHDLVGLAVVTEAGEHVGTVADVLQLEAHDVLVVRRPNRADALVPAVEAFLPAIDLDAERVVLRPIEGLL